MALQRQSISIPISEGLDTKTDSKQVMAGKALALENVRFQKTGKLSKRFGLVVMTNTANTGNLSSNSVNAIASDNESINAITSGGVYAYSESYAEWNKISELKDFVKIKSEFLTKTSLNHFNPEMDYSPTFKLLATIYREREEQDSLKVNSEEYVTICLEDELTGLKLLKRRRVTTGNYKWFMQKIVIIDSGAEPIIVQVDSTASVLRVVVYDKHLNQLDNYFLTPTNFNQFKTKFDVVKDSSNVFITAMTLTDISLYKLNSSGSLISSRNLTATNRLGIDTFDHSLGLCTTIDNNYLHLIYLSNTGGDVSNYIVGIGFDKSLNTVITESRTAKNDLLNLSICKNANEIIIAAQEYYRNVSGSYVYYNNSVTKWVATYSATYTFTEDYLDTNYEYGARLELLSRPFILNSKPYVVCKCPELTQKTGIIYSLDEKKSISSYSPFGLSDSRTIVDLGIRGNLSFCNAVVSNGIVYSYVEKIYGTDTDNPAAYDFIANVAISKLTMDFNTDYTSGTKAKVGEAIYYTNGRTAAIDARGGYESGFELRPTLNYSFISTGTANPNVASKTFSYIAIYIFYNGKGEIERSIPSTSVTVTTPANASYLQLTYKSLSLSYKDNQYYDPISGLLETKQMSDVILYRTENNGSVFYRCSNAPNTTFNSSVTLYDAISDADLRNNERLYSTAGVLESDSTPNAKFSTSGGNRLFLGGLEEQDEIAYSKKQLFGETVSFSDFFRIRVSSGASADKTPISALGYMDGKLIIYRQQSIYFIQGDGPNELGLGEFSEPEIISSDVGCTEPRSVLNVPMGVMFKSRKGIYLLGRGLSVEYIGAPVEDFNQYYVISSIVSDKYNEARFYLSSGDCIVYNFLFQTWSTFKNQTVVNADIWKSQPVSIKSNLIYKETENTYLDGGASGFYSMKFISPWLKLDLVQGYIRTYQLWIIGDYKSAHTLKCRVYTDYDDSVYEDYSLVYSSSDSPQYQFQISLPKQKVESIKFEIYDSAHAAGSTGEAYDLSNIQVEVGIKAGGYKLAASKSY